MRICHLTSVHPAKDIRIFHKECKSLANNGYDVTIIAPNVIDHELDGVKFIGINNNSKSRIFRMFVVTKKIYNKAINLDADIYHFHDPELMLIGLKLMRKGKKVIYDVHEDLPKSVYGRYWIPKPLRPLISIIIHFIEVYVAKRLSGIITVTKSIYERFKKVNKNTVIINNYPILSEALVNIKDNVQKENQICYIGGVSKIRGNSILINALEKVTGNVMLQIAGVFDPVEYRSELMKKKGWGKVIENGWVSREKTNEIMRNSVAGIITYLPLPNHINAQPNKLFEYMSAGIPVIASNFPLWREIVESNNCGVCVNPESTEDIAKEIDFIIKNPKIAMKMGENGRKVVENKYNWKNESKKLIKFYEKIYENKI